MKWVVPRGMTERIATRIRRGKPWPKSCTMLSEADILRFARQYAETRNLVNRCNQA